MSRRRQERRAALHTITSPAPPVPLLPLHHHLAEIRPSEPEPGDGDQQPTVDQEPVRATDFTALAGYYRSSVADLMRQIALLEDPDRRERAITHARLQIAEMNGRLRMLEDLDLIPRTTAAESRSEE